MDDCFLVYLKIGLLLLGGVLRCYVLENKNDYFWFDYL